MGTPRLIKDEAGTTLIAPFAEPYGESSTLGLAEYQPFFFTGHERDENSGAGAADVKDYMHMRTYWPLHGRFTSPDPVGGSAGWPQSWNRNSYVSSNPLTYIDPRGLEGARFTDEITVSGSVFQFDLNFVGDKFNEIFKILLDRYTAAVIRPREKRLAQLQATSLAPLVSLEEARCHANRSILQSDNLAGRSDITVQELELKGYYKAPERLNKYHPGTDKYMKMSIFYDPVLRPFGGAEINVSPTGRVSPSGVPLLEHRTETSVVGTFNFGPDWITHTLLDVAPYKILGGNGPCEY